MPQELPPVTLGPGQTVLVQSDGVVEFHGNTKQKPHKVRVTDTRPYPVEPPPVDPPPPPPPPVVTPGPFPGFAKADAAVAAGGTVDVPAGTYKERFTLTKPGVTWRLATGAQVDLTGLGVGVQDAGVKLKGDDIKFVGGRIFGSSGAGYMVDGNRVTVTVEVDHCIEEGYVWHGVDGLMKGGENHHNNESGQFWDSGEQGAGKANTKRLTIDGVHLHHIGLGAQSSDGGQGFWYDSVGQISSGEVKNCLIHDVYYAGIMFEISDGGKLHDNVIHHCGMTPSGNGYWGSGLLVSSARNAECYDNTFAYNQSGVRVVMQARGDRPGVTTGVSVHGNTFIGNPHNDFAYVTDDEGSRAAMFAANSGNVAYANRFGGPIKVEWNRQNLTTLAQVNALPGGGGSVLLTPAQASAALVTPLAPNGINP